MQSPTLLGTCFKTLLNIMEIHIPMHSIFGFRLPNHNRRKIMMVAIVFWLISFLYFIYMFEQCMYLNTLDTADIELYSQYNFDKIPIPGTVRSYLEFNTIFSGVFMGWKLCKIIFDILFCVLCPPGKRSFVSVVWMLNCP